jgi:hypothetical protein
MLGNYHSSASPFGEVDYVVAMNPVWKTLAGVVIARLDENVLDRNGATSTSEGSSTASSRCPVRLQHHPVCRRIRRWNSFALAAADHPFQAPFSTCGATRYLGISAASGCQLWRQEAKGGDLASWPPGQIDKKAKNPVRTRLEFFQDARMPLFLPWHPERPPPLIWHSEAPTTIYPPPALT